MTTDGSRGRTGEAARRLVRHVVIPGMMSAAFLGVALAPAALLGCRTRGLLALVVALTSGLCAIGAAIAAVKGRARGDADASWLAISALVLAAPVVAMLALA